MRRFIVLVVLALLGLPAAGASAATLGEQRVLMMLTTWGPEPYAPATIRAELDEAAAYIRSVSFGKTWIAGEVTPWLHALASKPGCDTAAIAQAARSAERRGRLFVRWRRGLERGSGLVAHEVFVDGRRTGRVPTVRTVASIAVATDDSLVVRVSRGRHRLRVVAIDRAGNRSRPVSRIVRP